MSDLMDLRRVADQVAAPDFAELVAVAGRRRRRSAAVASITCAAVVALAAVVTTSGGHREATPPTDRTGTTDVVRGAVDFLTVDEVVGHPRSTLLRTLRSPDDAGAEARVWTRCRSLVPSFNSVDCEVAVEVTQGGRSSRHMWGLSQYESYDALPGGAFYVDLSREGVPPMILRADLRDPVALRDVRTSTLLPARPGTDVVACGSGALCVVDVANRRLMGMDVPVARWAPTQDTLLWGVTGHRAVWVDGRGQVQEHALPTSTDTVFAPADTREKGVLAFYRMPESGNDGERLPKGVVLVASSDGGTTWRTLEVPATATEAFRRLELPADWHDWSASS
ncbi:hypothetical protein [Phycicoccus sp. Soil802]|uniref:hypothetical protein n=1 Tax=Phycicoccus sp. Soil802 TaxID=1736414 RepID=UPI0007029321|nr:hypothetical protein [Phycicoccus sp. Soil802]KRF28237.1 hypothetical protein ASG91_07075 [Phycicoccus sp. Soil802]